MIPTEVGSSKARNVTGNFGRNPKWDEMVLACGALPCHSTMARSRGVAFAPAAFSGTTIWRRIDPNSGAGRASRVHPTVSAQSFDFELVGDPTRPSQHRWLRLSAE